MYRRYISVVSQVQWCDFSTDIIIILLLVAQHKPWFWWCLSFLKHWHPSWNVTKVSFKSVRSVWIQRFWPPWSVIVACLPHLCLWLMEGYIHEWYFSVFLTALLSSLGIYAVTSQSKNVYLTLSTLKRLNQTTLYGSKLQLLQRHAFTDYIFSLRK